jgi:hypothetical protein
VQTQKKSAEAQETGLFEATPSAESLATGLDIDSLCNHGHAEDSDAQNVPAQVKDTLSTKPPTAHSLQNDMPTGK